MAAAGNGCDPMMRNTVVPLLWTMLFGAMFGAALWFSIPGQVTG